MWILPIEMMYLAGTERFTVSMTYFVDTKKKKVFLLRMLIVFGSANIILFLSKNQLSWCQKFNKQLHGASNVDDE